jgi:hypothetical protein
MNTLLQQLMELTYGLAATAGAAADLLASLRRFLAAWLIQQNPGFAPVVADPDADPELMQAAREGEALASELNAAGVRLRWLREPYLAVESRAERARAVFGPFIDDELALVQFAFFENTRFVVVVAHLATPFHEVREPVLLLPAASAPDAVDPLRWNLPAGTVWLRADRLAAGAQGFAALRISGGVFNAGAVLPPPQADGTVLIPVVAPWRLSVEPEPAPAADGAGSDGNALAIELPLRLELGNGVAPLVSGSVGLAGFGDVLRFSTQAGATVIGGDAIAFPFDTAGATWRIAGNRSPLCKADGSAEVAAAVWSLPLSQAPLELAGEAAHGGSVALLLRNGPALRIAGASGVCRVIDSVLSADARSLEWKVRRAETNLSTDVALWDPSSSQLQSGAQRLAGLRFASRRNGADLAALEGGSLRNRWNRPLAASNRPFDFEGTGDATTLIAESDGLHRTAASASRDPDADWVEGYALQNLYLHLRPARRMVFVGSGAGPATLAEGRARLVFDVCFAQPMLPDPYANNWSVEHLDVRMAASALRADIAWSAGVEPAVHPRLRDVVSFPQPPPDVARDDRARDLFRGNLDAGRTHLALLDLSGRDQQFGLALENLPETPLVIDDANRMNWPLRHVRLLMQPQVHWEPVHVLANDKVLAQDEVVFSTNHGGPTLVGAASIKLVPVLPGVVGDEIAAVANGQRRAAALFGLPFGMHAFALMEQRFEPELGTLPILALLHQPGFVDRPGDVFEAARQLRLVATGAGLPDGAANPSRTMPGLMTQTANLRPNANGLVSVLSNEVAGVVDATFANRVPLHRADLSGYGLSTFSRWRRELPPPPAKEGTGVTQVRFDVLVGRTTYEVIELQSRLWTPQCRMVRTIILERRNSGEVTRYDSGWNAIEDGNCRRYAAIETGVVKAFRNIRNVRIAPRPLIEVDATWTWQEVRYDADLHLQPEPDNPAADGLVPIRNHVGYIQIMPVDVVAANGEFDGSGTVPGPAEFDALMKALGHTVGGPLDAAIKLGGTLPMQLSSLEVARDSSNPVPPRFVLAASGSPGLPRAGQWAPVRIDGKTRDASPVDPRRGLPVIRRDGEAAFVFREAALAYQPAPATEFGLLMSTSSGRVLFPAPSVTPGQGTLVSAAPLVADPYALTQASGAFPRPAFALQCQGNAIFQLNAAEGWKLLNGSFMFTPPVGELAKGGEWAMQRGFPPAPMIQLGLDTIGGALPWAIGMPQPDDLRLHIDGLPDALFILRSAFKAASDGKPGFAEPTLVLGPALKAVQEIVDVLGQFVKIGFDVDVDVSAGNGPSPSFIVQIRLQLRLPKQANERIDIGVGKFQGRFEIRGRLEAALSGATRGRITVEMRGDVQQAIIPPVLFAGGQFRFVLEIAENGKPLIELGVGTVASIGGDLIKNLIEVEATVHYGYMLIPQTLQPGVMLGMEVRAKLLAGLLGLSFGVAAMARLQRVDSKTVTIWCELRAAATVQVAWLLEEEREITTQFEQKLPLQLFALAAGANPLAVLVATAVEQV